MNADDGIYRFTGFTAPIGGSYWCVLLLAPCRAVNSANVPLQNEARTAAGAGNSRTGNHLTHVKDNFDRSRELIRNQGRLS